MFTHRSYSSLRNALLVLRISVAVVFFLHAIVRVLNNTIPQFAAFLQSKGLPFAHLLVWMITVFELAGSILLALGFFVKNLSRGFIIILVTGTVLIHVPLGWFVGEHGTGGVEYSFILIITLYVLISFYGNPVHKNHSPIQ